MSMTGVSSPLVSVVIPTRDRMHLLAQAITSAKAAGTDVEIIVVDDHSKDDTARLCHEDELVRYVPLEEARGAAAARNAGIQAARGRYIAFLDDDDLRLPGSLD